MVIGSQAMLPGGAVHADRVATAIRECKIPAFLGNYNELITIQLFLIASVIFSKIIHD